MSESYCFNIDVIKAVSEFYFFNQSVSKDVASSLFLSEFWCFNIGILFLLFAMTISFFN